MAIVLTALTSNVPNAPATVFAAATGVIPAVSGTYWITYAGVCALTLIVPPADGIDIYVYSLTAHAHTITTPALAINGADDTATYSAATLDYTHLKSFGGQWFQLDETGITLSEV